MKVLQGKGKAQPDRAVRQRRGLLAKVHIAIKELGIPEYDYRYLLKWQFNKGSARDLSILELHYLVDYFQEMGWQPRSSKLKAASSKQGQVEALRGRIREVAGELENGDRRLQGLVKKLCGVDRLEWCMEVGRLKGLVAALGRIATKARSHEENIKT